MPSLVDLIVSGAVLPLYVAAVVLAVLASFGPVLSDLVDSFTVLRLRSPNAIRAYAEVKRARVNAPSSAPIPERRRSRLRPALLPAAGSAGLFVLAQTFDRLT